MSRIAAAQIAWDYMAPPEDPDYEAIHVHNMMRDDDSDVVFGIACEYEAEVWYCAECDHTEIRNQRKVTR